jgi:pimeloyl-ACP methyl ester carboxylesterase
MSIISNTIYSLIKRTPQYKAVIRLLAEISVDETLARSQNQASKGHQVLDHSSTDHYVIDHIIEDGIERVTFTPKQQIHRTSILLMHGMWHGAWCWQQWQAYFAEKGWRSVAFSLPGHGQSAVQKPTTQITLDYYLAFLRDEMTRFDIPPVLIGHSMGGALAQWYLRYINDDLPAVVLVGSWVHDSAQREGFSKFLNLDPMGLLMISRTGDATPLIRTPEYAARLLISKHCLYTPQELHAKLSPESNLIMLQHNPPFWEPPQKVHAPILCVAGEQDAVLSVASVKRTAAHYIADFILVPDAAHNLMMDAHYLQTADQIEQWLVKQSIT